MKLYIDEEVEGGETTVCSFHPPEFALKTRRQMIAEGGVVAAERKPGEEENVRGEPEGEIEGESEEENDA